MPWVVLECSEIWPSLFHPKPNHIISSLDHVLHQPPDILISLPLFLVPTPPSCPVPKAAARLSSETLKTLTCGFLQSPAQASSTLYSAASDIFGSFLCTKSLCHSHHPHENAKYQLPTFPRPHTWNFPVFPGGIISKIKTASLTKYLISPQTSLSKEKDLGISLRTNDT